MLLGNARVIGVSSLILSNLISKCLGLREGLYVFSMQGALKLENTMGLPGQHVDLRSRSF
jgi:hypothetical protein